MNILKQITAPNMAYDPVTLPNEFNEDWYVVDQVPPYETLIPGTPTKNFVGSNYSNTSINSKMNVPVTQAISILTQKFGAKPIAGPGHFDFYKTLKKWRFLDHQGNRAIVTVRKAESNSTIVKVYG